MKYYTFPISVEAYSQADAQAKLDLLLAIGSVLIDFKLGDFAGAFLKSKLLETAGKAQEDRTNFITNLRKEFRKKRMKKSNK